MSLGNLEELTLDHIFASSIVTLLLCMWLHHYTMRAVATQRDSEETVQQPPHRERYLAVDRMLSKPRAPLSYRPQCQIMQRSSGCLPSWHVTVPVHRGVPHQSNIRLDVFSMCCFIPENAYILTPVTMMSDDEVDQGGVHGLDWKSEEQLADDGGTAGGQRPERGAKKDDPNWLSSEGHSGGEDEEDGLSPLPSTAANNKNNGTNGTNTNNSSSNSSSSSSSSRKHQKNSKGVGRHSRGRTTSSSPGSGSG